MTTPRKRVLWLLAGITVVTVLAYGIVVAYLVVSPSVEDYAHRTKFDATAWRNRSLDGDPQWPTRLRMIDDLIASKRLHGLGRDEVRLLLGPGDDTDKGKDWDLVYWLGPERGIIGIDSEWLVIRFDRQGRVADSRTVRD